VIPVANALDCLSSTVVRTKRDVMQSGQLVEFFNTARRSLEAWLACAEEGIVSTK
jgi:hypothetical protein